MRNANPHLSKHKDDTTNKIHTCKVWLFKTCRVQYAATQAAAVSESTFGSIKPVNEQIIRASRA